MKKSSNLTDKGKVFQNSYRRNRLVVFLILVFTLVSMTVAYSANLNTVLHILGYATLDVEEGKLEITNITSTSAVNIYSESSSMYIQEKATDGDSLLVAEFDIDYYRSYGSSTMSISYEVEITNNTFRTQTLSGVNSEPTFTSGTSTLDYTLEEVNVGTTVLKPGESVVAVVTFSLGSGSRNTHYIVNEVFSFEFSSNQSSNVKLIPSLETFTVIFNDDEELKKVSVYIVNSSEVDVTYNFSTTNSNFLFVDEEGNELSDFTVVAQSVLTVDIYLKIADDHIFIGNSSNVAVQLQTTSPSILTYGLGNLTVTVPDSGVKKILEGADILADNAIDFTAISSDSGVYKNSTSGEITYFYRGNVSNNYVSLAGFTWRIIRIDKYGMRIILDSVLDEESAWASSNIANGLDNAISVLSYDNSLVKPILDKWYTDNLESYSDLIEESMFCDDFSYQSMTSSGSGYTTYYFGSYIRNGPDSSGYTPEFVCDSQYVKKYEIGLISGDEVGFAGALFNSENTNYYLYNSEITSYWWTMSPSYYDTTLNTVGILVVDGSNGKFHDWQNGSTIANENAIRPVITIDPDRLISGSGLESDPYVFS